MLYCQLKTSLKTHPNPRHWTDSLPTVLLGVSKQLKDDLHCTAVELAYGTVKLPGEFFDESKGEATADPACYVCHLAEDHDGDLQAVLVHKQTLHVSHNNLLIEYFI